MARDVIFSYRRKVKRRKRKPLFKGKITKRYYNKSNKFARARTDKSKARILAEQMTGSNHVKIKKRKYPRKYLEKVEKELGSKFEIKPKVYVYSVKRGHKFKTNKNVGTALGASHMPAKIKIEDGGPVYHPKDPYIILPRSHLKDKKIYKTVLIHELAESLALQDQMKRPTTHQLALKVEKKLEKELGTDRNSILKKAQKLWNEQESWK
jgi:hypothetical protein